MIVSATELAQDSKAILDRVMQGEEVQIQQDGKPIAVIHPQIGWTTAQAMVQSLNALDWSDAERAAMKKAIDEAAEVIGYAGGD